MYARYVLFTALSMAVNILAYLLSPFLAAYSVRRGIDVLPYPLSLLHTHDNTLDGGQKQGYEIGGTGWKLWWQRTRWICRNPGYGFDAYILGFDHAGYVVLSESGPAPDFSEPRAFYSNRMRAADGKLYFTWRRNIPLVSGHFLKIWVGWNYMAYGGVKHQLKTHFVSLKRV